METLFPAAQASLGWQYLEKTQPCTADPLHLAIGVFDGVHRGHQAIIKQAVQGAKAEGARSGVLTFWPHPSHVLRPGQAALRIMPLEIKGPYLQTLGVEHLFCQHFDADLAALQPEAFVLKLKNAFPQLRRVYVGALWRFGAQRSGDIKTLQALGAVYGFEAQEVALLEEENARISSTRIREHLVEGRMAEAVHLMGHPYLSVAPRVCGAQRGRQLDCPTVNMLWDPELPPRLGVYAGWVRFQDRSGQFPCVLNYGLRPTVGAQSTPLLLEVHVLEPQSIEVPEGTLTHVSWLHFLRPECKFPSLEALKSQIHKDKKIAKNYLERAETDPKTPLPSSN